MNLKTKVVAISLAVVGLSSCATDNTKATDKDVVNEQTAKESKNDLIKRVFSRAEVQYTSLINEIGDKTPLLNPRSVKKDGSLRMAWREDWTSGFFPGTLWYMYEYTKADKWKVNADKFTMAIDSAQFVKWHHDVGFMVENSFGNGYRLTGNEYYKQAVIDAAKSLSTRYRPVARIIQSWDTDAPWIAGRGWDMPAIIDNMMNLNLMYKATGYTKDNKYADIANNHAAATLKNAYRDNGSCFHLVDYDHKTGKVRSTVNFQGYSDPSSWARGQAWGLYGFMEVFRETGNVDAKNQAIKIADYIMNTPKIPADKIPYWDYDDPKIPESPRDASAAALVASALIDMSELVPEKKAEYLAYAEDVLRELSSDKYLAKEGTNGGFILMHSVGNFHEDNENDSPLNYADYYFMEALVKWQHIKG
ncbi:MAG: glycoside hydrolase family 88 protein [Ichthyobacteriaceae bacterium]|nr:glycoside hydrolase family 88 protein [Ichthyobacteriaceae bacterium]